ncbi:MAG: hypothetical protein ABI833_21390 [Acidobacteriota bacterium]
MKTTVLRALPLWLVFLSGTGCRHRPPIVAPVEPAKPISLLAGTTLALRTAQAIDSSLSTPGQTFAAVISRDANDASGQNVLPSGSPVTLILVRSQNAAPNTGFELAMASVTLNGNSYLVRNQAGASDTPGSGAQLGAFLGGVPSTFRIPPLQPAEGGSQLVISPERIRVPLGSLLTFRLDQPVYFVGSP